ncbi:rod-binding protein [Paracoccus benzoatiresistens]|uniref:Rod-binding protein n=1 Tax=Paracoccus benzoatiresistens TaxID=2997341 RepID=A0ABT4J4Q5_9RHOB|nr:rod-binding protein [Paracoccus sp. EF6]MCZ0962056.1 rod-binding protein [Paracoccus sp. EF6]
MHVSQIQVPPPTEKSTPPAAEKLEQAFLEEMLKYCGPKSADGAFGGGIGEDQFGSFLTQEYAAVMAAQIDLGFGKRMGLQ